MAKMFVSLIAFLVVQDENGAESFFLLAKCG
jgi:hypothetical protein